MAHRRQADAYDYLATSKVSELTVAQLEQALENSFLNKSNIEFWKGPITMHRLLEVSRTYPWGLPIPEESAIFQDQVAAGETITIKPPGTEIWEVRAMRGIGIPGACTTTMSYADAVYTQELRVGDAIPATGTNYDLNTTTDGPFYLTNSLWLTVTETGASNGLMILMSYHKVSL